MFLMVINMYNKTKINKQENYLNLVIQVYKKVEGTIFLCAQILPSLEHSVTILKEISFYWRRELEDSIELSLDNRKQKEFTNKYESARRRYQNLDREFRKISESLQTLETIQNSRIESVELSLKNFKTEIDTIIRSIDVVKAELQLEIKENYNEVSAELKKMQFDIVLIFDELKGQAKKIDRNTRDIEYLKRTLYPFIMMTEIILFLGKVPIKFIKRLKP